MLVGTSVKKIDGLEKVTGAAKYTVDLQLPRMLHAKLKRSPVAHAKIVRLDTSKAELLPGVRAVMTAADVPPRLLGTLTLDCYFVARDRVRIVGEPVAAVAADNVDIAAEACELIEVEYEELPAVFDPEEAMLLDPPAILHEDYDSYERLIAIADMDPRPPNVWQCYKIRHGDFEATRKQALEGGGFVVSNRYSTGYVHTAPMEPHAAVAEWHTDGSVTVWTSNQSPYIVRDELSQVLELAPSKIRVVIPYVGGAFGGKLEIKAEPFCVVLSRKTKRPVKLVLTRAEEFSATAARTPFIFYVDDVVSADGLVAGRRVKSIFHGGGYTGEGFLKPIFSTHLYPGSYRLQALEVDSYGVYTNRISPGALRGFGCAESAWPVETQMDIIAEKLGVDPIELRMKNLLIEGEASAITMPMHAFSAHECLTKCAEAIRWGTPLETPEAPWRRGRGLALGNKYSFAPTASATELKVYEDATFELRTSAVDLGQGAYTVLTQIVADEFGVGVDQVKLVTPDTAVTPFDHVAGSSRQTFRTGNATRRACDDAKRIMFERAAPRLGAGDHELSVGAGFIFVTAEPDRRIPIGELFVSEMLAGKRSEGHEIIGKGLWVVEAVAPDPNFGQSEKPMAYMGHGAQACEVDVNVETGQVVVHKFVSVIDVGKAMNPQGVEMQNLGGVIMGLGIACLEELCFDGGTMTNANSMDYKIPGFCEVPLERHMTSVIVEQPHQHGPYGAKGAGEIVIVPTLPAIGNAVYDAIGVRIFDSPLTPEKILRALGDAGVTPLIDGH